MYKCPDANVFSKVGAEACDEMQITDRSDVCECIVYQDVKKRVIVVTARGKELIDRYIRV